MKFLFLSFIIILSSGCAHNKNGEFRTELDEKKPLQVIRLTEFAALPAQNDKIVESRDLDKKLEKINETFRSNVDKAQSYEGWTAASVLTSLVMLGVCAAQDEIENTLAWCGGSIGLSILGTRPLAKKSGRTRIQMYEDYNQQFK